jgi:hypothetical protein
LGTPAGRKICSTDSSLPTLSIPGQMERFAAAPFRCSGHGRPCAPGRLALDYLG